MTAHSLKTIKVKHKARFVGSKQRNSSNHVGFTEQEARGIFGSRYEFSEEEKAYMEKIKKARAEYHERYRYLKKSSPKKKSEREQEQARDRKRKIDEACAALDAKVELQRQHDELKSLGLNLVGFKQENGQVINL